ncbi:LacI family transcriptional regulator [Nonomuraea sp. MG754425]|uniref:LacI family DNA-binding transcriptional regulator n=1 Tax=Nonomuraea sp. MG754425 TaxID=2570319 RepID=UPI001F2E3689|nr:LacI family DNA-binding transcriptional regulator [Nonomuraea sp. MG754425]MCF6471123.1 LacI family transcriptional regulator [Nonomuraea sp. MG754425]
MAVREPRRRVTIADVARHAQVSTTAVSKVLRNAYGASPAMRDRVKAAIEELGYRPQAAARAMRGRTFTIGVLIPHVRNPFFADLLDGIGEQLGGTDYQAILVQGGGTDLGAEARAIEALVDRQVDGILMIAPITPKARLEEVARWMPTIVIGRHERSTIYDAVFDDDDAGTELVVRHLIELGHRRIGHISQRNFGRGRPAALPHLTRAETYRRVMREHGLGDGIDVVTTTWTEEGGHAGTVELLSRSPRPTAVFAGADQPAFGALSAVHEAGLRVPQDVSIAGYDDTRMAAMANISLTSVDQDGALMGRTAARLLLERVEGRTAAMRFSVTPVLVARRSTGPAPTG